MKESFKEELKLGKDRLTKLRQVNGIIEEYLQQGYTMTLRQLYYQLVSRGLIQNNVREYRKLGGLLVEGRMAGEVDWEAIEDRIRVPYLPYSADGPVEAIDDLLGYFRLDRQKGQDVYMELWVEKDALSGVLKRMTSAYHINLMVNRGYSSCTAMHDGYERILEQINEEREVKIFYLGDHDPSGLDMVRDIEDRLFRFITGRENSEEERECLEDFGVSVEPIGLNMEQIKKYKPPPNPAKITDPRAAWYVKKFGKISWEVDALPPDVLHKLVSGKIEENMDLEQFDEMKKAEEEGRKKLKKIRDKLKREGNQ